MGKAVSDIPLKMWIAAFLISLPSFLFGYVSAALNSCLITVSSFPALKSLISLVAICISG
jgi:hypothetical protein